MPKTAHCFEKYGIDALFLIGGFEAFTALSELRKAREKYDAFKIPMVILPVRVLCLYQHKLDPYLVMKLPTICKLTS
jgi:hypothetical protein